MSAHYHEGAPCTLIEAAPLARPLIAADMPGFRTVVAKVIGGLLCEARSGESLAAACLSFLGFSREDKIAMCRAGRDKMKTKFDHTLVVQADSEVIASEVFRKEAVQTA
jgi:hypothetical protein